MPKPRSKGNGEGTVYKRGKDSWVAQYYVPTPTGKKRRTIYAKNREEAAEKLAKAISDRAGGIVHDSGNLTAGQHLDAYLKAAEARVRQKTHRRYKDLVKVHLAPTLGRVKLKALSPHASGRSTPSGLRPGTRPGPWDTPTPSSSRRSRPRSLTA